jgi:hypothetical protein
MTAFRGSLNRPWFADLALINDALHRPLAPHLTPIHSQSQVLTHYQDIRRPAVLVDLAVLGKTSANHANAVVLARRSFRPAGIGS